MSVFGLFWVGKNGEEYPLCRPCGDERFSKAKILIQEFHPVSLKFLCGTVYSLVFLKFYFFSPGSFRPPWASKISAFRVGLPSSYFLSMGKPDLPVLPVYISVCE